MGVLSNLKPERVFYFFEELSKIPRGSGNEKAVSEYLKAFGEGLGFETIQDEALNIIIKKPATAGFESAPSVILQGHMDMVCEKNEDFDFNFLTDAIPLTINGDFVLSENTTLGADNGIAVAMSMAILESKDISHPALEVLVTTDEERGMTGAQALKREHLNSKILINVDSEEEGVALVSCAGGERDLVTIPVAYKAAKSDAHFYKLSVRGLYGGHSGVEINKQRGNSNLIFARVLDAAMELGELELAYIEGGSKSNAIPRYTYGIVALADDMKRKVEELISSLLVKFKNELGEDDKNLVITLENTDFSGNVFADVTTAAVRNALLTIPNGVLAMSREIEGLVESSNNLGVIKTENDEVTVECAPRSSVESLKHLTSRRIAAVARANGAKHSVYNEYPAWEYRKDSQIREIFIRTYKELTGTDLIVGALHAGLECGLFAKTLGADMDMISFGPNLYGVHAPGEKMSISSVERSWKFLLEVLKNIK